MPVEHRHTRVPGKIDPAALASFTPATLASCVGWFDVNYEVGWNDGDLVNLWTDRVAINGNASAAGAKRPTYKTNIVNGKPVFRFAGNHSLDLLAGKSYANGTWFFVLSRAGTGNSDYMLGNSGNYSYLQYAGNWYSANGLAEGIAFPQGFFRLKCVKYDGTHHTFYTNGGQDIQGNCATGLIYQSLGADGYNLYADIAEIILCNTALSDADRILVETYINIKYALW